MPNNLLKSMELLGIQRNLNFIDLRMTTVIQVDGVKLKSTTKTW